jgi:cytochrome c oxidase cbb3-type subunit 3
LRSMHLLYRAMSLLLAAVLVPKSRGQTRTAGEGARLFSANCAACHGSDGHGGERAPSIATLRNVITMSDSDLEGIVGNGLPGVGMPGFGYLGDEKVSQIVAYLRILQGRGAAGQVKGDAQKGQTLFYGKAQCSRCHMVDGQGGFIAGELSAYGKGLSASVVRRAIVEPNIDLEPTSRVVEVQTADGRQLAGMARAEDNFTLDLQTEDGRYHMLPKSELKSVQHTGRSIMPEDYEKRLSSEELDDLVKYLIFVASAPHPEESASEKKRHVD